MFSSNQYWQILHESLFNRLHAKNYLSIIILFFFLLPIIAGFVMIVLLAFDVDLVAYQQMMHEIPLVEMLFLSLSTGIIGTVVAFIFCMLFIALLFEKQQFWIGHCLFIPLFVIPHSALAIGLQLLLSPASMLGRLIFAVKSITDENPLHRLPAEVGLPLNDDYGLSISLALVLKELPFIWFIAIASLNSHVFTQQISIGQTLGLSFYRAFYWITVPQLYKVLRLPLYCVFIYGATNVEIAQVLGPTLPTTLSVYLIALFQSPEIGDREKACVLALFLLIGCMVILVIWRLIEKIITNLSSRQLYHLHSSRIDIHFDILSRLLSGLIWCVIFSIALFIISMFINMIVLSIAGYWVFPAILPESWQFDHWQIGITSLLPVLKNTLIIAVASTLIAFIIALVLLQYPIEQKSVINNKKHPENRIFNIFYLLYLPIVLPQIAFLFGLVWMIRLFNLPLNIYSVIIVHVVFILPYLYFSLKGSFERFDNRYEYVAMSLGKHPFIIFITLKLRMLLASIVFSLSLGLLISLAQYLSTLLLGAGSVTTLSTEAIIAAQSGSRRLTAVYGLIQIILSSVLVVLPLLWLKNSNLKS